ncbi:hypothetical protein VNI00_004610 [Paramarasmius palmivorus]|uniref:F-box domain-containing protein n=1 Tax=Paramarasmius palmivorus TaxID=297713 RepID=A0AAW0DFG6_9AGAR
MDIARTIDILEEEEYELQRHEDEIQRYRLVVEKLEAERDRLRRRIEERRSWMAPIRRLPVEILQQIFIKVCTSGYTSLSIDHEDHVSAPALTLSRVSAYWRNVSCGQRALWSSVSLALDKMTKDLRPLLNFYLTNAADHPLKIHIYDPDDSQETLPNATVAEMLADLVEDLGEYSFWMIDFLTSHFAKCEELSLDIPPVVLASNTRAQVSFPLLHTLHLDRNEPTRDENGVLVNSWMWNAIRVAPVLRELTLCSPLPAYLHYIPWERLTSLTVYFVDAYRHLCAALARCCRLVTFDVDEMSSELSASDNEQSIAVLPCARYFTLAQTLNISHMNRVIASLTLPALRELKLVLRHPQTQSVALYDFRPLHSMCQRSCWSITTLNLSVITAYNQ